jgi:hypothetical protein
MYLYFENLNFIFNFPRPWMCCYSDAKIQKIFYWNVLWNEKMITIKILYWTCWLLQKDSIVYTCIYVRRMNWSLRDYNQFYYLYQCYVRVGDTSDRKNRIVQRKLAESIWRACVLPFKIGTYCIYCALFGVTIWEL